MSEQQAEEKGINNAVFALDLGDKIAFLAMEDVAVLGRDTKNWPAVTKEKDQRSIGTLLSGRGATADRHAAAKAYAAMWHNGESKAALCAARWLRLEVSSTSMAMESHVRSLLRKVSDSEAKQEIIGDTPKFCSTRDTVATEMETAGWGFGGRVNTVAVLKAVAECCRKGGEGWIPVCTGGQSLGFLSGDFDIVVYSSGSNKACEKTMAEVMGLSSSGRAKVVTLGAGEMVAIDDMIVRNMRVKLDVVFAREGQAAYDKIVLQGLFMEWVLAETSYMSFFEGIRERAKASGVVDGPGGMLNMWSIMLTGVEWLANEDYLGIRKETPLAKQRPVRTGLTDYDLDDCIAKYFRWMASAMADPSRVFFSLGVSKWSKREKSEFAMSTAARVCRDPFSIRPDNTMRTVRDGMVGNLIARLEHCASCSSRTQHVWRNQKIMHRLVCYDVDIRRAVITPGTREVRMLDVLKAKGAVVAMASPAGRFGVSDDESDARIRATMNVNSVISGDVELVTGPALNALMPGGLSVAGVLSVLESLYSAPITEEGIWVVGLCSADDIRDARVLEPMGQVGLETLLAVVYEKSEHQLKSTEKDEWAGKLEKLRGL